MTGSSPALNARQQALLTALNACGDEMSGQQLHRSLDDEASMGLATVYRNLRQLSPALAAADLVTPASAAG